MIRAATLALVSALLVAGCAGGDGATAQALLRDAAAAQERLISATFAGELSASGGDQRFAARFEGGGYLAGDRAGDVFVRLRLSGVPGAPEELVVVARDGVASMSDGTTWMQLPQGAGGADVAEATELMAKLAAAIEGSITEVHVTEGRLFEGEPVTVVAGRLDTARLLSEAFRSGLSELEGAVPPELFDVERLRRHLGELRVSLMVSERTSLVHGAVVSLSVTGDSPDETFDVRLTYRLTSANEPVELPAPGA